MGYLLSLPSRRLPVECAFSPDGLFEARFRVGNMSNLREGEQLPDGTVCLGWPMLRGGSQETTRHLVAPDRLCFGLCVVAFVDEVRGWQREGGGGREGVVRGVAVVRLARQGVGDSGGFHRRRVGAAHTNRWAARTGFLLAVYHNGQRTEAKKCTSMLLRPIIKSGN